MDKYTGAHDQICENLKRMEFVVSALNKRGTTREEDRARQERFRLAAEDFAAAVGEKAPAAAKSACRRWWQFWK